MEKGRLIAPDLIGMGDSEKLDDSGPHRYTYVEHRKYLVRLTVLVGRYGAKKLFGAEFKWVTKKE